MGSGSSRSRVAAYETLPADSQAYAHPADTFDAKASSTAQSTGSLRKRPVTNSAASHNNQPEAEPSDAVRVRASGRGRKPKEDALAEPGSLPGGLNAKEDALQTPMPKKQPRTFKQGSPAPQMLASQQDTQNLPLPQPQPLHRRHLPISRQIQEEEEPLPLHLRQQAEEKWTKPEDRVSQEEAALAAIRSALPKPKARPTSSVGAAATKAANTTSDPLAQIASMQAGRAAGRQAKNRFPTVNVSISHRKVLLHWVKIARKRVVAIQSQAPQQRRKPKKPKPVRIDRLVELYLENEEELERMCFEEPQQLILTQIEALTRRIDELDDEVDREKLRREAEMIGRKPGGSGGDISQAKAAAEAKREATQRLAQEQEFWDWETAFDSAVTNREAWKNKRGEQEKQAQASWRSRTAASWPAPMQQDQKRGKAEVAEQMKSERERLKSLLARFEAQKRREKFREEQPVLDQVEALQEEQRKAMAERAAELREQRAREAAEKKRRQEEAAERRRQAEEDRRRAEEEAKERELRQRLREEEERRRREREAEEAERRRRKEEERELERLRQEKKESERKRAEERRAAEVREAQRLREIEERRRQEEERLAAERRKREEDEARQRQKEEEELRRAEQERRRQEEERRRQEEEERQQAVSRAALLESAFDMLEEAADDDDEAGNDEDAGEQAWQAALSTLEAAPAAAASVAAEEEEEEPEEPQSSPASPSGGADWMSRALGALNDADDSEESDEEDEAGESKNPDPRSDSEKLHTDMQFIKLAGAITKKIDQIHGE
eukprot:TRINITY_DN105091_c0_g1_i1.p1 TRINITY_DN105091_c0_g1~~TRINITY_DN105091_c0_g1_i1.p1  ORF type:complete len:785 (+),score=240.34 TRINITY_DN105091_c0_g1_i1:115-2469(+)